MKTRDASVAHRFAIACRAGSVGALRSVLAADVVAVCDSGAEAESGQAEGADTVARCVIEKLGGGTSLTVEEVNGEAGVVLRTGGAVVAVVCLKVVRAKVTNVWVVLNPDKLRHWG